MEILWTGCLRRWGWIRGCLLRYPYLASFFTMFALHISDLRIGFVPKLAFDNSLGFK